MENHIEEQETSQTPDENETQTNEGENLSNEQSEIDAKNRQLYERAKKSESEVKELRDKIAKLEAKLTDSDDNTPQQDKVIEDKIATLEAQLASFQHKAERDSVFNKFPVLNDKLDEFDAYLEENKGMKLEIAAKSFLVENDLFGKTTKRLGLEKAGGGKKVPPTTGKMTAEDAKRLRDTNYKEYKKRLLAGQISISD